MKKNHLWKAIVGLIAGIMLVSFAAVAYAHGVVISYTVKTNGEVELYAEFDTGEPMGEAQVTIYSPADPQTPWLTGTADEAGRYVFVIDPELEGWWDIQYRKAGHGNFIHFELETGMIDPALVDNPPGELLPDTPTTKPSVGEAAPSAATVAISSGGFTSFQILLMSASVIWGFVGTALYFSSRKTQEHGHARGHHH